MATSDDRRPCISGHTVQVFDRGGKRLIDEFRDISYISWGRERDEMGEAVIRLEGPACTEQADLLNTIRAYRHEMVIFRGDDRVFEGPLHRIGDEPDSAEIVAKDCFAYYDGTSMSQEWDNSYPNTTEVTTRIQNIVEYEMQIWEDEDPPANLLEHAVFHHFVNEARTTARTAARAMNVGTHIRSLARTGGVDWTMVGRGLHVWDVSRPAMGRTRVLTEADFETKLITTEYGADLAIYAYVNGGTEGLYGSAQNSDAALRNYYGPWAKTFTNYDEEGSREPTQAELDSQASRNLVGRAPAPIEVRVPDNSGIILSSDLTINMLIPGIQMPLRATANARKMSQVQKLDSMRVIEDGEDGEVVRVTLLPATRPDSDEEPEE